jgi:hypothetical protein
MVQTFADNPWLILCALIAGVIVICAAIALITDHIRRSQQAEIDATLKQGMIERGMSAADIKTVLEARSDGEEMRLAVAANQGVRVGLGSFQVEVGSVSQAASEPPTAPAVRG